MPSHIPTLGQEQLRNSLTVKLRHCILSTIDNPGKRVTYRILCKKYSLKNLYSLKSFRHLPICSFYSNLLSPSHLACSNSHSFLNNLQPWMVPTHILVLFREQVFKRGQAQALPSPGWNPLHCNLETLSKTVKGNLFIFMCWILYSFVNSPSPWHLDCSNSHSFLFRRQPIRVFTHIFVRLTEHVSKAGQAHFPDSPGRNEWHCAGRVLFKAKNNN